MSCCGSKRTLNNSGGQSKPAQQQPVNNNLQNSAKPANTLATNPSFNNLNQASQISRSKVALDNKKL